MSQYKIHLMRQAYALMVVKLTPEAQLAWRLSGEEPNIQTLKDKRIAAVLCRLKMKKLVRYQKYSCYSGEYSRQVMHLGRLIDQGYYDNA